MTRIALFSSGNGTNAENIAKYFDKSSQIIVSLIVSNKQNAYVHERAKALNIPSYSFTKEEFMEGNQLLKLLSDLEFPDSFAHSFHAIQEFVAAALHDNQ